MSRRVLSMWQPWATLTVAFNGAGTTPPMPAKEFETRHFQPRLSVPIDVVIHAAKRWNAAEAERITTWPFAGCLARAGYSTRNPVRDYLWSGGREYNGTLAAPDGLGLRRLPLGALIGVATIVAVVPTHSKLEGWDGRTGDEYRRVLEESFLGDFSAGRFAWQLANAIDLPEPIPFRGRQDVLFELDAENDALVDEQLAAVRV